MAPSPQSRPRDIRRTYPKIVAHSVKGRLGISSSKEGTQSMLSGKRIPTITIEHVDEHHQRPGLVRANTPPEPGFFRIDEPALTIEHVEEGWLLVTADTPPEPGFFRIDEPALRVQPDETSRMSSADKLPSPCQFLRPNCPVIVVEHIEDADEKIEISKSRLLLMEARLRQAELYIERFHVRSQLAQASLSEDVTIEQKFLNDDGELRAIKKVSEAAFESLSRIHNENIICKDDPSTYEKINDQFEEVRRRVNGLLLNRDSAQVKIQEAKRNGYFNLARQLRQLATELKETKMIISNLDSTGKYLQDDIIGIPKDITLLQPEVTRKQIRNTESEKAIISEPTNMKVSEKGFSGPRKDCVVNSREVTTLAGRPTRHADLGSKTGLNDSLAVNQLFGKSQEGIKSLPKPDKYLRTLQKSSARQAAPA